MAIATACAEPTWIESTGVTIERVQHQTESSLTVFAIDSDEPAPMAVLVHGCCGEAGDMAQLALALAAEGLVVVNVPWTNEGEDAGWPRSYQDVACGLAFALERGADFGGDAGQLILVGWSDGALLTSVVALGRVAPSTDCVARAEPHVSVTMALSGFFGYEGGARPSDKEAARFLGGASTAAPGDPHSYLGIGNTDVQFALVNGSDDPLNENARLWAQALEDQGVAVTTLVEPGGHFDPISPRTPLGATTVEMIVNATSASDG